MFVAFEGIDGSGKTTLSNLVCRALRGRGVEVVHARESGVLASAVARRIRELTRDPALLEMDARAELFLNLAREAQQLEQVVRPALAQGRTCIADRSLHSIVALASAGRGLPDGDVAAAAHVASRGLWPDLVVLVDVEPALARLRKRAAKVLQGRAGEASSRKGLAGAGLQVRIREHLLDEARVEGGRWLVVSNLGRPLAELADEIADELLRRRAAPAEEPRRPPPRPRRRSREEAPAPEPGALADRFMAEAVALAGTEPALAAMLVASIPGPREHALRAALARSVPRLVARGLAGLGDAASARLRRELLLAAPAEVAASLAGDASDDAMRLREELLERAPAAVAASLGRIATPAAWALRERALLAGALAGVVEGLAGVAEPRAFALRSLASRRELWAALGRSLSGVPSSPEADALRAAVAERDAVAALRSVHGVDGSVARQLRERLFRHAPRAVLRSLGEVDASYAWALRERAAPATKEALDSVDGMDHPRAWALRLSFGPRWPATAVSSLRHLVATERGRSVVARALAAAPGDLVVLRNAHASFARIAPRPEVAPAIPREETCSI